MKKSLIFQGSMLISNIHNTKCIKETEKEELDVKISYFKICLFTKELQR